MSILSALKTQTNSIDDLAALPQAMIMQMAQKGQIREDMLAPILGRKAEMAEAVARTRTLQGAGGQQPTVMEQIMQKNADTEAPAPAPRDMGVAQLPVRQDMYQGMAGGGIVAFVDGGDVDDEDDEQSYAEAAEEAQIEAMLAKNTSGIKRSGLGDLPVGINPEARSSRGIESLQDYVMRKESGGRRYDKEGKLLTSSKGAEGEMQVMPGTQRDPGFGVKAARDNSPDEKARVGRDYLEALLNRYQDPKVAAIAYNWGPGNTDKWLADGGDMKKLPKETRNYVAQLAEGGEVRHFATGDYLGFGEEVPYDPSQSWGLVDWWKRNTLGSKENIDAREKSIAEAKKKSLPKKDEAGFQEIVDRAMIDDSAPASNVVNETVTPKEPTAYDKYFSRLEERRAALAKGASEDKNLALLAAGLGMMGGTSPYALANIGAGGQKGVEQYAASKRSRAAEELALDKAEIAALKTKEYADIRKQGQEVLENSRLRDDLQQYQKMIQGKIASKYPKGHPMTMTEEGQAKIARESELALANDPVYNQLLRKAYPNLPAPSAPSGRRVINAAGI